MSKIICINAIEPKPNVVVVDRNTYRYQSKHLCKQSIKLLLECIIVIILLTTIPILLVDIMDGKSKTKEYNQFSILLCISFNCIFTIVNIMGYFKLVCYIKKSYIDYCEEQQAYYTTFGIIHVCLIIWTLVIIVNRFTFVWDNHVIIMVHLSLLLCLITSILYIVNLKTICFN